MPFEHTPKPGSWSHQCWKRRYKEDYINFWSFLITSVLIFVTGIVALTFLWLPRRHLTQGYVAQHLPDIQYTWNNTFFDDRAIEAHTATCTADFWWHSYYLAYDCTSSGSLDSLTFNLQSSTPYVSRPYRTRSVTPSYVKYYTSAGYAAVAAADSASESSAAAGTRTATGVAEASSTFASGFSPGNTAFRTLVADQSGPTQGPQVIHKRQISPASPTTAYDHLADLSSGTVIPAVQTYAPEPSYIPVQTPKINENMTIFFTVVIVLGIILTAATFWMVLYNLSVARNKTEPPAGFEGPTETSGTASALRPILRLNHLMSSGDDSDSIVGDPAPPYSERRSDPEAQQEVPPKEEGDEIMPSHPVASAKATRMSVMDAYNLLPSYAIYGWWQALSMVAFTLEIVAWALLASFVTHLVTFFRDGGCIAEDTEETDLSYAICRRPWGSQPVIWSALPGALPATVMSYGYPVVVTLIMMVIFFLAHLALFVTLCRKSVLCLRHDAEPLNRDNSHRYVGVTRAGYFCFLETPGNHHPVS